MTKPRIGSLFTGVAGLDLAVEQFFDATTAWHAQYEPPDKNGREDPHQYAAAVLAHRFPGVPNHGDITTIDWAQVEPVDILTGGFPCQDLSLAGKRAGLKMGTRSGLWFEVLRAISILQPRLVVLENVRGLLAKGELDHDPNDRCVCGWAYRRGGMHRDLQQQEIAVVLDQGAGRHDEQGIGGAPADAEGIWRNDLALAGGNGSVGLGGNLDSERGRGGSSTNQGGPVPAVEGRAGADSAEGAGDSGRPSGEGGGSQGVVARGDVPLRNVEAPDARAEPEGAFDLFNGEWVTDCPACGRPVGDGSDRPSVRSGMGTVLGGLASVGFDATWCCVRASDAGAPHQRERVFILAWPAAADADEFGAHRPWACGAGRHEPADHGEPAADADGGRRPEHSELPTGRDDVRSRVRADADRRDEAPAADPEGFGRGEGGAEPARLGGGSDAPVGGSPDWGVYGAAIRRWEHVTGRAAPRPVDDRGRLAPVFVEWMMGAPAGWFTDVPVPAGMTASQVRNAQLKAGGNGVVTQQAFAALGLLWARATASHDAAMAA